jgi:hypothetical protein
MGITSTAQPGAARSLARMPPQIPRRFTDTLLGIRAFSCLFTMAPSQGAVGLSECHFNTTTGQASARMASLGDADTEAAPKADI